ncbi:MAG TPA: OmpA family protein [Bacteroidia bacterium]|nr:OmpA family protein [Bacteroidia bacterium]
MKLKRPGLILFIAGFCFIISASVPKEARKYISQGDQFFVVEDYGRALGPYKKAYGISKDNSNLCFKIGVCCLHLPAEKTNAENYLAEAVKNVSAEYSDAGMKETNSPPTAWYYYGEALHFNNKPDSAIAAFEKYAVFMDSTDKQAMAALDLKIRWCRNGIKLMSKPVNILVENLGPNINTKWPEYSPVISADQRTLIFTTRRPTNTGGAIDAHDGMYFEDIYISTRNDSGQWSPAKSMDDRINTPGHEASIGISADGTQLFLYKDDAGNGNIYVSQLLGASWMVPQKLSENINSKSWEASACISPDGSTLYFSSTREGGFGGRDLWSCKKLPTGEWARPVNLGAPVNTPFDEDAPAILANGSTLYYASNGPESMGGFDILYSIQVPDSGWRAPVNVGYPVNSSGDDAFFVPTPDDRHAYFSSASPSGGYGEKDIYFLTFPEKEEARLTVLEGEVKTINGVIPPHTSITLKDVETGKLVGTYVPNSATGRYVLILPAGKNYNVTYEAAGFLYQSDNIDIVDTLTYKEVERPVKMEPVEAGHKIIVRNIFFSTGKSELQPESKAELDKVIELMNKLPKLTVEISGHTDATGPDDLNQRLSQERAKIVASYLIAHGIEAKRLRTIGYGESRPIAINYNPDGTANTEGMNLNRRFEFKVLSFDGVVPVTVEPVDVPENLKNK